ncbi:hypothetical protein DPMN_064139 [Dreissena polymorpha]|uniref:Uncharacterized protein n=1 Tax=Dreissena polymorpha TaxID=45954 RepID=A0A9D4HJ73_DREPO|nr:hypothetical protein DPMN_064139 [Dreissena polymorpha]
MKSVQAILRYCSGRTMLKLYPSTYGDWSASERCSVGIENKWNSSQTQDIYLPIHVEVSVVVIVSVTLTVVVTELNQDTRHLSSEQQELNSSQQLDLYLPPTFKNYQPSLGSDTGDTLRCNIRNMTSQTAKNCIWTSAYGFGPYRVCGCLAGHYNAIGTEREGWHHRLKRRAKKGNLPFYLLVQLLCEEAKLLNTQVRLVREGNTSVWKRYNERSISTSQLLDLCSAMNGPV